MLISKNRVFIIAEMANSHEGVLENAKKIVSAAAEAGADAIKFQKFFADELAEPNHEYYSLYKKLEIPKISKYGYNKKDVDNLSKKVSKALSGSFSGNPIPFNTNSAKEVLKTIVTNKITEIYIFLENNIIFILHTYLSFSI